MYTVTDDGQWVNENFERLAAVIKDYNQWLELQWIPPRARTTEAEHKQPYRIWHAKDNYIVFYFSEDDTPVDVLDRLLAGDQDRTDVFANLERHRDAEQLLKLKREQDAAEDHADKVKFLMRNPLHTTRFNGHKLDDQLRRIGPAVERKHL